MTGTQPTIDPVLAIQNAGGNPDLAKDLYQMLQEELPGYLEKIPACYQQGDFDKLYHHVHKLNGSATYCGVPALKAAVHTFEQHLKQELQECYADDLNQVHKQISLLISIPVLEI